jgi:putative DNA primase/helicase
VEHTNAFFRRFIIIHFDQQIPEKDQDKELSKKIIETELSGVFNWILDGLNRLVAHKGFSYCESVESLVSQYKKESDSVALFIEENNYHKSVDTHIPLKLDFSLLK